MKFILLLVVAGVVIAAISRSRAAARIRERQRVHSGVDGGAALYAGGSKVRHDNDADSGGNSGGDAGGDGGGGD